MASAIAQTFWTVQQAAVNVLEPIRRVFLDWDEAVNVSKLCLKVSEISETVFGVAMPAEARTSISSFCEISRARGILKKSYEIISGDAGYEKEGSTRIQAPAPVRALRFASKITSIVGDALSLTKWLQSSNIISRRFFDSTRQITAFGKSIKLTQGITDAAGFLSGALMIPVNITALVESVSVLGVRGLLRRTYLFDLAQDIAKLAALVLLYIPGVPTVVPAAVVTVSCIISLGRFVKKNYFSDPTGRDRPDLHKPEGFEVDQADLFPQRQEEAPVKS